MLPAGGHEIHAVDAFVRRDVLHRMGPVHQPAAHFLLHDADGKVGPGRVQRRRHAAYAAADDQDVAVPVHDADS